MCVYREREREVQMKHISTNIKAKKNKVCSGPPIEEVGRKKIKAFKTPLNATRQCEHAWEKIKVIYICRNSKLKNSS